MKISENKLLVFKLSIVKAIKTGEINRNKRNIKSDVIAPIIEIRGTKIKIGMIVNNIHGFLRPLVLLVLSDKVPIIGVKRIKIE
jgi:hypothetical protein